MASGQEVRPATLQTLVQDLNRVIQQDNLYDKEVYQSVQLEERHPQPIQLVQKNGERQNIISLNRQLVEQLFPGSIRELQRTIDRTRSRGTLFQDVGSLLGMFAFICGAYSTGAPPFWARLSFAYARCLMCFIP